MTLSAKTLAFLKRYRRPWTVAEEMPLTIAAIAFFLFSGFIASVANAFLDFENPFASDSKRVVSHDPLLNLLHYLFVTLRLPKKLPDQLIPGVFPLVLIRIALGRNHSCLLLRRIAWMMGVGYFIRIPFVLMTMLPNPNPDCIPNPDSNFLLYAWKLFILSKESCGDVVFSGHTIPFMSAALI
ncbi:hypothetical protein DSO57_1028232 [Entomophthora muscae]|uniref:Uncharacterized protein n=1 Tax=Entomophthora muscae TaxID=34485 RepID=A0ACC2TCN5_9FUNG|nr:hypothetical protein DSO57_1028232 [Entomophthora muscae]